MPDEIAPTPEGTLLPADVTVGKRAYNPRSAIERKRAIRRQVREGVLMPWMLAYAEWLVLECTVLPKRSERIVKARALSRGPVGTQHLLDLENRADFIAYCDELAKGPLERARAKFIQTFPAYIEGHREALELAREAGDYKALAAIAEPVLDRVVPKKAENIAPAQVQITLTTAQAARATIAYETPAMLVEEVVPDADTDTP